jgi:hypothetical protein
VPQGNLLLGVDKLNGETVRHGLHAAVLSVTVLDLVKTSDKAIITSMPLSVHHPCDGVSCDTYIVLYILEVVALFHTKAKMLAGGERPLSIFNNRRGKRKHQATS